MGENGVDHYFISANSVEEENVNSNLDLDCDRMKHDFVAFERISILLGPTVDMGAINAVKDCTIITVGYMVNLYANEICV